MKKFTKFCLITSIVLILTGGIVFLLGAVSGGWGMMEVMDRTAMFGDLCGDWKTAIC